MPIALAWRFASEPIATWVHVTAPDAVEHLFGGGDFDTIDRLIAIGAGPGVGASDDEAPRRPRDRLHPAAGPHHARHADRRRALRGVARRHAGARGAAADRLAGFRRSTLRVLPRGHLQWRGEEYLHDVNSALAGYIRAQAAAGVIVGLLCVGGFVLLGVPSAVSLGVAAGVLELVPGIGPVTTMLIAVTQAGDRALAVIAFLVALRVVQDAVVYPRLIRHGMHLSTPALVLSLWTGAALGGAGGVILALPVAGFLSVSLRHWREYRAIERLVRTSAHRVVAEQPDRTEHEGQDEARRQQ